MNKWVGMGRATKDPEVRYTKDNKAIATINVAVDRRFNKDITDFFKCTAFGKTAEFVEKYIRKGTKVVIEGTVQNDNYEKDGVKHYGTNIIIEAIEFAESKKAQEQPEESGEDFMDIPVGVDGDKTPF